MTEITFSDILIKPQYSEVLSRSDVDTSSNLGPFAGNIFEVGLPVISANMKHITESKMAIRMCGDHGLGILHRFDTIEQSVREYNKSIRGISDILIGNPDLNYLCGVSIGVKEEDKVRFDKLYEAGARIFCIDVAHGHHLLMKNMIQWIKNHNTSGDVVVIAGNIATREGALDLQEWGADVLKVGIGGGSVCVTRRNTGVGVPQFSAIKAVSEVSKVPIISDGGIKNIGDIPKALIYADAVMMGSFIAGTSETPGKVFRNGEGQFYKVYGGSASGESKAENNRENKFVEGIMKTVPFQGHIKHIMREIKHGIQSAFSYTGANNLEEFQGKVEYEIISGGGRAESKI